MKKKNGEWVYVESIMFLLESPFTEQLECIISKTRLYQPANAPIMSPSPTFSQPVNQIEQTNEGSDTNSNSSFALSQIQTNDFMRALASTGMNMNQLANMSNSNLMNMMGESNDNSNSNQMIGTPKFNWQ